MKKTLFAALLVLIVTGVVHRASEGAIVIVAEDQAVWASQAGDSIAFTRADTVGTFFIKDGALETVGSDTGVWENTSAMAQFTDSFRLKDGFLNIAGGGFAADANAGAKYTFGAATASGYDTTTPQNTPLTTNPAVSIAGIGGVPVGGADLNAGTFRLVIPFPIAGYPGVIKMVGRTTSTLAGVRLYAPTARVAGWSNP